MKEIELLLVDDEAEFREATARALERRGFRVIQAESGERALERIGSGAPDIVVLDLRMEGMDGIDTLTRIRQERRDLPVIILTGHGRFDDVLQGINLNIVDFLQKPVDVERLATLIRKLMSEGRKKPLRERTIGELMVPVSSYRRVYGDQPLREVIVELREAMFQNVTGKVAEHGHRSVLVFDRQEMFLGCLRIIDFIDLVLPTFLRESPYSSYFTGMFLAQCKMVGNQPVSEVLGSQPTVDIDAPLMEAVYLMVGNYLINLPVMKDGEIVGLLRDKDLLLEIAAAIAGEREKPTAGDR
jgi:DNA-binding response OmpR family regulator